jgi:asparagine synthase (glutamine-hydrolysing)
VCGIVGIASLNGRPVLLDELRAMCSVIAHRGPDDDGFYLTAEAGLGHRRLSIIDLDTGRQPISNEDGSVWAVFNGEIYNYRQLRAGLEERGHRFSTKTDTETIIHLYEEEGEECVRSLRGMFAFAIWDDNRKLLLLARDRLGIKPLYFTEVGGRLAFGSEIKSILQLSDVKRELDLGSVGHLFAFLSTPSDRSIIRGIKKLEPATTLIVGPDAALRTQRYWDIHFEPERGRDEAYFTARLRDMLEESVELHMVSDVPVGAFLSGGVDSASVVGLISRLGHGDIKTFSVGFTEEDYSELKHARLIAKRFNTEHFELLIEPNILDVLDDLTWYLDEPFGDSSAIPTFLVSRLASKYVKVVLSGDGGDELFAGYEKYLVEQQERRYRFLSPLIRAPMRALSAALPQGAFGRNFLHHFSLPTEERYLDAGVLYRRAEQAHLFESDVRRDILKSDPVYERIQLLKHSSGHWLSGLQRLDLLNYLPLDILTKVDRMSMAHSLEVRPPLLDHKLLEFVATIPPGMLLRGGRTKHIFKNAMSDVVPREILQRPKQGFAVPLGTWFRGELDEFVCDLLLSPRTRQRGLFRPPYIEKVLELHRAGRNMDLQLWTLISFELWCRTFLDGRSDKEKLAPASVTSQFNLRSRVEKLNHAV